MMNEHLREVRRWGNSAGIPVPKEWLGKQVKVILVDRTEEIKKEVFDILSPYMENLYGIYLVGSYARSEQESDSDIDILAISNSIKKKISSGKYNIEIMTLGGLKNTLEKNPAIMMAMVREAKTLMNSNMLSDLREIKLDKKYISRYYTETKRIANINKELINIDIITNKNTVSDSVVYSLILRLRGIYILNSIISNKSYFNKDFKNWILSQTSSSKDDVENTYNSYKNIRDNKRPQNKTPIGIAEKLLFLLNNELEKHGKKKKAA